MAKKCKFTPKQCNDLEELRLGMINNIHTIAHDAGLLSDKINTTLKMVEGTEQNDYYIYSLKEIGHTTDFLKYDGKPESLYDTNGKEYRSPGYVINNIIRSIEEKCSCE